MAYSKIESNLYLISLDQKMTGFRNFISAWLFKSEEITILIDPGPKCSIHQLIDILKQKNFVLLDSQYLNSHTEFLGAIEISKKSYLDLLNLALIQDINFSDD